jgi:precorrin-8X/cobalt-precorrin-8 methylmutase
MPTYGEHAITLASFEQIDREIGAHGFTAAEYAIVRRIIHTTADFEFKQLIRFAHQPITAAQKAFQQGQPIVTDVSMVAAGIRSVAAKTWQSDIAIAVATPGPSPSAIAPNPSNAQPDTSAKFDSPSDSPSEPQPHIRSNLSALPSSSLSTRSAQGMAQCAQAHPEAIFAVGNAPTALLLLCEKIRAGYCRPALVIGAPVGFINVVESKAALTTLDIPHIVVTGRKGGSAVAAAILNALMIGAWEQQ